jgi:hypothetical protein
MSVSDLLQRRTHAFTPWLPQHTTNAPAVVIGEFVAGAPPSVSLFPWDTKVYILRQPAKGAG